jgi:hypothetical protein
MLYKKMSYWLTWFLASFLGVLSLTSFAMQPGRPSAEELMNWNPSPEEMAELEKMVEEIRRTDPKLYAELERQGQQILQEAGLNPADFQQAPQQEEIKQPVEKPVPVKQPLVTGKPENEKKPELKKIRPLNEVMGTVEKLQNALRSIHIKAQVDHEIARVLTRFKKEITDLLYYVPLIKEEKIAKHLQTEEFTPLFLQLNRFAQAFEKINNQLVPEETPEQEITPYLILGIKPGSTWEKIKQAYKERKRTKDVAALTKRLKKEEASPEETQIALRKNELQLQAIDQAYATLEDAKTRARFEREHKERKKAGLDKKKIAQPILKDLNKELTEAIYEARLLTGAKELVNTFNPEAEEIKKEQEEAAKAEYSRKDELKKRRTSPSQRTRQSGQTYYETPSQHYYPQYNSPYNSPYNSQYNSPYSNFSGSAPYGQSSLGGQENQGGQRRLDSNNPTVAPTEGARESGKETLEKENSHHHSPKPKKESTKEEKPACPQEKKTDLERRIKDIKNKFTATANLKATDPRDYTKEEEALDTLTKRLRTYKRKHEHYLKECKPKDEEKEKLTSQWREAMSEFSTYFELLDKDKEETAKKNPTRSIGTELDNSDNKVTALAQVINDINSSLKISFKNKNTKMGPNLSLERVKAIIDKRVPQKAEEDDEDED